MKRSRWWWRRQNDLKCKQVAELLHSYLDSELTDDDRARVATHLEACRDCGLEASTYQRIKASLAQPVDGELDVEALERLKAFGQTLTDRD